MARELNKRGENKLDPGALLVLLAMADVADEHDIAYPSRATIAAWTGQGESTVRRHVLKLEERAFIIRLTERRRKETGLFVQDAWTLNVDGDGEPPDPKEVEDRIAEKARARQAKERRQGKGGDPALKMSGGPALKSSGSSAQNEHAANEYPVSKNPVRTGEPARAENGAGSPLAEAWRRFLERQDAEDPKRSRSWFHPIVVDGDRLVAPSRFARDWIRQHFATDLRLAGIDLDEIELLAGVIRPGGENGARQGR